MQKGEVLVNVWQDFRLRLPMVQDYAEFAEARTVQAHPPIKGKDGVYSPSGRSHTVLVHEDDQAQAVGIQGATYR